MPTGKNDHPDISTSSINLTRYYFLTYELLLVYRVKSLSKGNNSKKDVLPPSLNIKESTTVPLSSILPNSSTYEDELDESDEFDTPEETYEQQPKPSWQKNGKLEPSYNIPTFEEKLRRPNGQTTWKDMPKADSRISHPDDDLSALLQVFVKHFTNLSWHANVTKPSVLTPILWSLQEEEDLVSAHRKQVEDTMNIVREVFD